MSDDWWFDDKLVQLRSLWLSAYRGWDRVQPPPGLHEGLGGEQRDAMLEALEAENAYEYAKARLRASGVYPRQQPGTNRSTPQLNP